MNFHRTFGLHPNPPVFCRVVPRHRSPQRKKSLCCYHPTMLERVCWSQHWDCSMCFLITSLVRNARKVEGIHLSKKSNRPLEHSPCHLKIAYWGVGWRDWGYAPEVCYVQFINELGIHGESLCSYDKPLKDKPPSVVNSDCRQLF